MAVNDDSDGDVDDGGGNHTMTCWKVVRQIGSDRFVSASTRGRAEVKYALEQWSCAPFGGLLAFTDLASARNVWRRSSQLIFRADGQDRVLLPSKACFSMEVPAMRVAWDGKVAPYGFPWPKGTLAFRRIRLVEQEVLGG